MSHQRRNERIYAVIQTEKTPSAKRIFFWLKSFYSSSNNNILRKII